VKKQHLFAALEAYRPAHGGPIMILPLAASERIYDFVVAHRAVRCLELGTGYGTTACVIAAAVEECGGGEVVTIDRMLHHPVNVHVLREHLGLDPGLIHPVVDELGYNWQLAELIRLQSESPDWRGFDFCFLDGAHEWDPDALAFLLAARLLAPAGTIAIDDLPHTLRMMVPDWATTPPYSHYSPRQLDSFQMRMLYDRLVVPHPDFTDFRVTDDGRIGWATKHATAPAASAVRVVTDVRSDGPTSLRRMVRAAARVLRQQGMAALGRSAYRFLTR
jgi:predicted O-methyltransferase YrrM